MLVLLTDVVFFTQVNEVDDWLCGEEEELVDDIDLLRDVLATCIIDVTSASYEVEKIEYQIAD